MRGIYLSKKSFVACSLVAMLFPTLVGCGSTTVASQDQSSSPVMTNSNKTLADWSHLSSQEKSQDVSDEYTKLGYTGSVSADTVINSVDSYNWWDPSQLTIQNGIDIQLASAISLAEEDKMLGMSTDKQIDELKNFINSSDFKAIQKTGSDSFSNDFTQKLSDLQKQQVVHQQQVATCPLKVIKAYVSPDSIGTPEAYVEITNISHKTIDAYKVSILCYNSFGDPVNDPGADSNEYSGIAQNRHISPGETSGNDYSWMLALQDTTTKITAKITEVHFTDGTAWSLDTQ